jgi:hypothetical protein
MIDLCAEDATILYAASNTRFIPLRVGNAGEWLRRKDLSEPAPQPTTLLSGMSFMLNSSECDVASHWLGNGAREAMNHKTLAAL